MIEADLGAIVAAVRLELIENVAGHDPGQEIVRDDVLVVVADELLHVAECQARVVGNRAVVEPQHQPLKLGHDAVLVVSRIADQRPAGRVPREVLGPPIRSTANAAAKQKRGTVVVHVGLIVGSTAIDVVEIECGGPEVHERVGIVLPLQAARWIERQVMVDELAEIGVERRVPLSSGSGPSFGGSSDVMA